MINDPEKRLIEALKNVDAHGDAWVPGRRPRLAVGAAERITLKEPRSSAFGKFAELILPVRGRRSRKWPERFFRGCAPATPRQMLSSASLRHERQRCLLGRLGKSKGPCLRPNIGMRFEVPSALDHDHFVQSVQGYVALPAATLTDTGEM